MAERYGASLEAWHHWSETLGLAEHLLPVISNPRAEISPDSNMKFLGKTPSRYNFRGQAAGFAKWTEHRSSMKEIGKWELEADYGICVQSRQGGLRAIDIDIPSKRKAKEVLDAIESVLPLHFFPKRYREDTGKVLLPFRFEGVMPKRVIPVEGGIIEFLGEGQQWIAEGAYLIQDTQNKTNARQAVKGRYLWDGGWPKLIGDVPLLTEQELEDVWETLVMMFANGETSIARQRREGTGVDTNALAGIEDPVYEWLLSNWEVRETGRDHELYIRCPFDAEHTSDSGPTETQYAPPGNGYDRGHFKCLHAHCMQRDDADYIEKMGWSPDISDAPDLGPLSEEERTIDAVATHEDTWPVTGAPRYMVDGKGRKENRAYNHAAFMGDYDRCGKRVVWDDFSAQMVWCPASDKPGEERWMPFGDEHYSDIVEQMDRNGFVPQSVTAIRPAVNKVAMKHRVDLAIEWAKRLPEWDGVARVERFWSHYAKAEDTAYTRAVGWYTWTAHAGRLLDPGCQADMTPILVGPQGARKTSLVAAIAPSRDMFVEISLTDRDEDTTRKMRGKLVAELGELRGMHGRDRESVKAFMTRPEEEWVPKYKEFPARFKRRFIFYGTTNREDFLADPTGERRYLPFHVGLSGEKIDVDAVIRDREQLWAEAIHMWSLNGIMWQEAEELGALEHAKFKEHDPWYGPVRAWLLRRGALNDAELAPCDMPYEWGTAEVLVGALGKQAGQLSRGDEIRVGALLKDLGCFKKRVHRRGWRYQAFREKLTAENAEEGNVA